MKTIFLAEGAKHVREALRLMMDQRSEFMVVGDAGTPESALAQVCQSLPEIVLLDWALPGLHPQRLIAAMRQCCPETLIFATSVRPELERIALDLGSDGFLLKQLPPNEYIGMLLKMIKKMDQTQFK
jgi:DNA-binding NarL/FixJ family response regulator